MAFRPGDKIRVRKDGFPHDGIYISDTLVVHNSRARGEVVCDTLAVFAAGQVPSLEQRALPGQEAAVVARAYELIGSAYNLAWSNCQHAASYAQTGVPTSPHVQGAVAGVAALLAAAASLYVARRPSYDPSLGASGGYRDKRSGRIARRPLV